MNDNVSIGDVYRIPVGCAKCGDLECTYFDAKVIDIQKGEALLEIDTIIKPIIDSRFLWINLKKLRKSNG